ncbi:MULTISPECIES: sensory rhodopsin transducer [unclassified Caballeronia]|uniref:sensory rhodopsin transducer n=1 Tax=unclassified Caballeronia TaxID=2646786 RepID=UPI002859D268|nr:MULTISPECIES: sensory rhodopsin transducer [unclassified Caballeronia]MDR5755190.1 sensory rhodopsin transducer [Caballeronia sp. LZ024]MDR5845031.1 sensory rhodopsin transducer [Caballeronia sp. LZ031]
MRAGIESRLTAAALAWVPTRSPGATHDRAHEFAPSSPAHNPKRKRLTPSNEGRHDSCTDRARRHVHCKIFEHRFGEALDVTAGVAMEAIGKMRWAIAEGYLPSYSTGDGRELASHEAACILNAGPRDAQVELMVFFKDREPVGPYFVTVPARRTLHMRFNDLTEPESIPDGTEYASVFESDVPIVVQYSRLDSRQAELALLFTIAFGSD